MVMLNSYKRQCNWAEAGCGQRQKHSFRRSASLRAGLRRKEGRSLFRYPALTSQRVRKRPRWLDVLGYSIPPCRAGWPGPAAACMSLGVSGRATIPLGDGWR